VAFINKDERLWSFARKVWIPVSGVVAIIKTLFFDIPDIVHKLGSLHLGQLILSAVGLIVKYMLIGIAILVGGALVSWPLRLVVWPLWAGLMIYCWLYGGRDGLNLVYLFGIAAILDMVFSSTKPRTE